MVYLEPLAAYLSNRTPHPLHLYIGDNVIVIPTDGSL
jgi:hypothetical protein